MNDVSRWLRAGDPVATDAAMSEDESRTMRRIVLGAVRRDEHPPVAWQQPLAVAATVALTLAGGVLAGHFTARPGPDATDVPPAVTAVETSRQLQFSTPGGTRIIWVFDAEFDLKETTP